MTAPLDEKAEHPRIWLEPAGAPDRCWCSENQWGDEGVQYILASEAFSAVALPDELEGLLLNLEDEASFFDRAYAPDCATSKTLRGAATALSQAHSTIAALRAERDEAIGKAERQWAGWVKEEVRRKEAEAEVKRLTEEKEALREALEELVDTLTPAEHASGRDPAYGDRVRAIGAEIGFGALMSCASTEWRLWLEENGYPVGSEFVSGPCRAVLQSDLRRARAALNSREKVE